MTTLRFVEKLRDLVGGVDVVLSDIWGVVHNGLVAFPEACEALHSFRAQGGTVILITNAPRPADSVQRQLRKLGVADATYDAIVSSGDLTRHFVADHPGRKMFWIGPERDSSIHRGLDPVLAPLEQADYIVCTEIGRSDPAFRRRSPGAKDVLDRTGARQFDPSRARPGAGAAGAGRLHRLYRPVRRRNRIGRRLSRHDDAGARAPADAGLRQSRHRRRTRRPPDLLRGRDRRTVSRTRRRSDLLRQAAPADL